MSFSHPALVLSLVFPRLLSVSAACVLQPRWGPLQPLAHTQTIAHRQCSRLPIVSDRRLTPINATLVRRLAADGLQRKKSSSQVFSRTDFGRLNVMADGEDIFLRAKHRTFGGLSEGKRAPPTFIYTP